MSTDSLNISAAQSGTNYTSDLNDGLAAINSCHSGASAPSNQVIAGKFWLDTSGTNPILKIYRNGWKSLFTLTSGHVNSSLNEVDINNLTVNTALTLPSGIGVVPSGGIIMWSGQTSAIPSGWFLCDGNNGTPNLTDKFVMGASSTNELSTGGSNDRTLVANNIPSHTHTFSDTFSGSTNADGAHSHSITDPGHDHYGQKYSYGDSGDGGGPATGNDSVTNSNNGQNLGTTTDTTGISIDSSVTHTHSFSGSVSGTTSANTTTGASFDNRPAYMALAYIMKS